jgi:hypothetical protein
MGKHEEQTCFSELERGKYPASRNILLLLLRNVFEDMLTPGIPKAL